MTDKERDQIIINAVNSPAGKRALRRAIQGAAAKAIDRYPEGTPTWHLARKLAGLPAKPWVIPAELLKPKAN